MRDYEFGPASTASHFDSNLLRSNELDFTDPRDLLAFDSDEMASATDSHLRNLAHFPPDDEGPPQKATPTSPSTSRVPIFGHASQLLAPRSAFAREASERQPMFQTSAPVAEPSFAFTSTREPQSDEESDDMEARGTGDLLEKHHNLIRREDNPAKRLKTSHLEKSKPSGNFNAKSGGVISEHIKSRQQPDLVRKSVERIDLAATPTPSVEETGAKEVVDLTAG